jgi:hypothetical protein
MAGLSLPLSSVDAQSDRLTATLESITAQLVEDGVKNAGKLFIFKFSYLVLPSRPIFCSVSAITVHGVNCNASGASAMLIDVETYDRVSSPTFKCTATPQGLGLFELTIEERTGLQETTTHRLLLTTDSGYGRIRDYKGTVVGSTFGKLSTTTYEPFRPGPISNGRATMDLNCPRLSVPTFPAP